jgi:hypothetical protein
MKKIFFLNSFALALSLQIKAQEDSLKKEKNYNTAVVGYFANNFTKEWKYDLNTNKHENHSASFQSFGLNLRSSIFKNTSIRFGLNYSQREEEYPFVDFCFFLSPTVFYRNPNTNTTECYLVSAHQERVIHIPLLIEYQFFSRNKYNLYAIGGFVSNVIYSKQSWVYDKQGQSIKMDDISKLLNSPISFFSQNEFWAGAGANYPINKSFFVGIEMMLKDIGRGYKIRTEYLTSDFSIGLTALYNL